MSIDWTKPVRRKGTNEIAEVLATHLAGDYPVAVAYDDGTIITATMDGRQLIGDRVRFENVPERKTLGWVPLDRTFIGTLVHGRKTAAVDSARAGYFSHIAEIYRDEDGNLCIEEHEVSK